MESLIVILLVTGAGAYTLRQAWKLFGPQKSASNCACDHAAARGCAGCPLNEPHHRTPHHHR